MTLIRVSVTWGVTRVWREEEGDGRMVYSAPSRLDGRRPAVLIDGDCGRSPLLPTPRRASGAVATAPTSIRWHPGGT
jgi:hypothetical protein